MPTLIPLDPEMADKLEMAEKPFELSQYNWQFLAEGDSWFSIAGADRRASNLLRSMKFSTRSAAISCAYPGDVAARMFTASPHSQFRRLLEDREWVAILVSASGNDLIDAISVSPKHPVTGQLRPEKDRILRTRDEVNHSTDPYAYVCEAGFDALAERLLYWFSALVQWRDAGKNLGRPIFLHTYSVPVARPAGAVSGLGGGWLLPALKLYGVPRELQQAVTDILFGRLRAFLLALDCDAHLSRVRLEHVHVFDSAALVLDAASANSRGSDGDWLNEIHLTQSGYDKVGLPFSAFIERRLSRYPMPAVAPIPPSAARRTRARGAVAPQ